MQGHWLYQFFPEAREMDLARTLGAKALFVTLLERGFQVKMQRRTYDQAVSLGTIQQIALDREHVPSLGLISDLDYDVGGGWLALRRNWRQKARTRCGHPACAW